VIQVVIIIIFLPSVVKIPRVKSKVKNSIAVPLKNSIIIIIIIIIIIFFLPSVGVPEGGKN